MKLIQNNQSYPVEQIKKYRKKKILFVLLFSVLVIILLISPISPLRTYELLLNPLFLFMTFLMALGVFFYLSISWLLKKFDNLFDGLDDHINISRKGASGERLVLEKLAMILDDSYTVFSNYKLEKYNFDFDFLIISPKGLIAMEVKNLSDSYKFLENELYKVKKSGYEEIIHKMRKEDDFRNKLKRHCDLLNSYLYQEGFQDIKAKKVIVFVNDRVEIEGKSGIYIVKGVDKLRDYFEGLTTDDRFTEDFCSRIVNKLSVKTYNTIKIVNKN